MSLIDRRFQLADESGLGLHCTPDGVTLAGIPLLRATVAGLAPKSREDLYGLLEAAYGRDLDAEALSRGLTVVAKALNDGDLGRAMIAAVRLRLPDVDAARTGRLVAAYELLAKGYNAREPRDWHGRWTTGGGGAKPPATRPLHGQSRALTKPVPHAPSKPAVPAASARSVVLQTAAAGVPPRAAVWDAFKTLYPNFQSQFDDLGPVEFAKRVTKFGEWIEAEAHFNRPFDRAAAKAEYYFLQNRLSFWLDYQHKPFGAYLNLISASQTLFQGATNSGLVRQGDPDGAPWPMAEVVGLAAVLDAANAGRSGIKAPEAPTLPDFAPTMAERAGVALEAKENAQVGIGWGRGIQDQGNPWEEELKRDMPDETQHYPRAKTWDFADPPTRKATSAKTLDTTTYTYSAYPERIFSRLKNYIDDAADYDLSTTREGVRIPLDQISSREIQLAIPEETSPAQMDRIVRAQRYSESRGVRFVVTRIK